MLEQLLIREIGCFIDRRFAGTSAARAIAGIVQHEQRRVGRAEVADNRPDRADGFAVAIKPEKGGERRRRSPKVAGGFRRLPPSFAIFRRQIPPTQPRSVPHRKLDQLTVSENILRIRQRRPRGGERDPLLEGPEESYENQVQRR